MSFAVNDRPGVSSGTRERILAAARELGWRPSASRAGADRGAHAGDRARAGALAPRSSRATRSSCASCPGSSAALTAADYALLLQIVPGEASHGAAGLRAAGGGRARGRLPAHRRRGRRSALRAARGGRRCRSCSPGRPVGRGPFPWVETRHDEGIAPAVEHLVDARPRADRVPRRARRSSSTCGCARSRWRAALAAAGLPPGPVGHVVRRPDAAALALLREEPTAVVCASDALALGGRAPRRASSGSSCPSDVSVTGFDDSPLAALATPALTSVRVDYAEFGAAAAARAAGRDRRRAARRSTRRRCRSWSCAARPRARRRR